MVTRKGLGSRIAERFRRIGLREDIPELRGYPVRPPGNIASLARFGMTAMEEQQPPTLRIVLDDAIAQGQYINFANIIHSPSEFVIDLGRIVPGNTDVKIYSRVIMAPLHAKQLLEALAHNISLFEEKFGEIRLDPGAAAPSSEPSN